MWMPAVQHMLERVTFIAPFPEGATEKERSYTMNFNATATNTRMKNNILSKIKTYLPIILVAVAGIFPSVKTKMNLT